MSNQHTKYQVVSYARMSGALLVQLKSALAVLKYHSQDSSWAKEESERIESLLKEIDEGEFEEYEVAVPTQKAPF